MTRDIRWRILTLQAVGVVLLAFLAGFCFWGANFTHDQVTTQLSEQQVFFPPANSAAIKALPTQADRDAMNQYGGQQLTNGDQAQVYANHFINIHLKEMGYTYSQISEKYLKNPKDTAVANLRQTIFMGTMLRGTLLEAYAWWTIGTYALYAGIGLALGSVLVFFAFLFELLLAPRGLRIRKPKVQTTQATPVGV